MVEINLLLPILTDMVQMHNQRESHIVIDLKTERYVADVLVISVGRKSWGR